jgi:hypothetical protein
MKGHLRVTFFFACVFDTSYLGRARGGRGRARSLNSVSSMRETLLIGVVVS